MAEYVLSEDNDFVRTTIHPSENIEIETAMKEKEKASSALELF